MFNIEDLKIFLEENTEYTIKLATATEEAIPSFEELPIISIGYSQINSESPTTATTMSFPALHGEDLIQVFEIKIHCLVPELHIVWQKLFSLLIGRHLTAREEEFSGFTYKTGGVIGLDNSRMIWLDLWNISFPTINVFTN